MESGDEGVEDFGMEEVEVGEEGEEFSEDGEQARVPRVRRAPRGPTQIERELHEFAHLPYRDWCGHCVRGAGEKTPRRRRGIESKEEKLNKAPRMVLNYHHMSTRDAGNDKTKRTCYEGRVHRGQVSQSSWKEGSGRYGAVCQRFT